jgi:alanine-alpha-ketoisovalerate/valine-pyruvate aminotransferase
MTLPVASQTAGMPAPGIRDEMPFALAFAVVLPFSLTFAALPGLRCGLPIMKTAAMALPVASVG